MPYQEAWDLQDRWAAEIAAGARPPSLLLLEHPPTYTFGRRGQAANMLWDEAELERRGVSVYWVDRGGDVTFHGPGQLVGYPLLPLAPGGLRAVEGSPRLPQADFIGYIRKLEQTLILALGRLGLPARQVTGLTGVWTAATPTPAKLAAIGVKVDVRGISRHGFALNVDPDMTYWNGIIGCGIKDAASASLAGLLDPPPSMQAVTEQVVQAFREVFDYSIQESR